MYVVLLYCYLNGTIIKYRLKYSRSLTMAKKFAEAYFDRYKKDLYVDLMINKKREFFDLHDNFKIRFNASNRAYENMPVDTGEDVAIFISLEKIIRMSDTKFRERFNRSPF